MSGAVLARQFGALPEKLIAVVGFVVPAGALGLMRLVPGRKAPCR